ncbi:MAG: hypothetical protein IJV90_06905 [Candidatus Methanomethylophilaceae archaeon]|nr:hypothetical protein [Candidatus Methanomethylophilaceae archaeon]
MILDRDHILIPVRPCTLSTNDVMRRISKFQEELGKHVEVFLDGDEYAILGRERLHMSKLPITKVRAWIYSKHCTVFLRGSPAEVQMHDSYLEMARYYGCTYQVSIHLYDTLYIFMMDGQKTN